MHHLPIVEREDGLLEIGLIEPLGPFVTRQFAEAVAAHTAARVAWLRRNTRHREEITHG